MKLQVIVGTTRPSRVGHFVGHWAMELVSSHAKFDAELIDLVNWPLPFFQEGHNGEAPVPVAVAWMQKVAEADAYLVIAPEYNHGIPGVLKNALDYGFKSWRDKPVAFIGYSGDNSGGARGVEQARLNAVELAMAPIKLSIFMPHIYSRLSRDGSLHDDAAHERGHRVLDQLHWWADALAAARASAGASLKSEDAVMGI